MGYLEKVFIGTLLLFALLILFMFGLYFDIGSMVQSAMHQGDGVGRAGGTSALSRMERASVAPEVEVADRLPRPSRPVVPRSVDVSGAERNFEAIYERVSTVPRLPTFEERLEITRKELARKGFSEPYIEMEVGAMDDREYTETITRLDEMVARGAYDEAERYLLELVDAVPATNLVILEKYYLRLQGVYFDSNQLEKYRDTMRRLFEIEDKVLAIQAASPLMEDPQNREGIEKAKENLGKQRGEFDEWYGQIASHAAQTGHVLKFTDGQKSQMKAGLLREREAGRLSAEDLQSALDQIEDLEKIADGQM